MAHEQPIVKTKLGTVRGKVDSASDGQNYYTFHRIPYAKPPVGDLRFKAPQPALPWTGVLDTTIEGDECYSKHQVFLTPVGSEDCLKLNVYTHSTNNAARKPVMVWLHGGGFTTGSAKVEAYGPEFFMCENIVLVSITYRLGIFGFLSLNDKSLRVPGNAGLKDQVMALRWVQENIECFGGDANNVTLFGESAGAAAAHYLICSPMAKGLFHKAILQSGSALNHWARGTILPHDLVKYFKMEGKTESEILDVLMNASKEELLVAQYKCKDLTRVSDARPFSPVIEGFNPFEPSLLLDDPLNIMNSGNYNQMPMIIGYNSHEGMLMSILERKAKLNLLVTNFDHAVPFKYKLQKGSRILKTVGDKIRTFYYGTSDPSMQSCRPFFHNLQTDNFFLRGIYQGWRAMLQNNQYPMYLYRFAFDGDLNLYKHFGNIKEEGVCHGDDVFYMFKTMITPEITPNSKEEKTIQIFIKYWTNFARTTNPNPPKRNDLLNVSWPKTNGSTMLHFGEELKIIDFPEIDRMLFWDKIDAITNNKL